jgi:hypothetical protein
VAILSQQTKELQILSRKSASKVKTLLTATTVKLLLFEKYRRSVCHLI